MNKYQEALNEIRKCNCENCYCDSMRMIEELVERATPKKAKNIYDENESCKATPFYEQALQGQCPHCYREVQPGMSYCSNCGQAIDWSED